MIIIIQSWFQLKAKINMTILLLLLSLMSCDIEKGTTSKVEKEYYENDVLKSEINYSNDSTKMGEALYYYKNGNIARICYYVNNKLDSIFLEYYSNGKLKYESYYDLDKLVGSVYFYYPNGQLELYNARDYAGENFYVVKYDSLGNKLKEEGVIVSPNVGVPKYKEQYVVGDSIVLRHSIAEPLGYKCHVSLYMYKFRKQDKILVDSIEHVVRNDGSIATYKNKFNDTGHYSIVCVGRLIDTANKYVACDTAHTDIFVKTKN